jgi:hypothetical protein
MAVIPIRSKAEIEGQFIKHKNCVLSHNPPSDISIPLDHAANAIEGPTIPKLWTLHDTMHPLALLATHAATLFVAQSNGDLSVLSLTSDGKTSNLSITSTTRDCASNPSWLTLDSTNHLLYCLDRGLSNATKGSLNSFSIGQDGLLTRIDRADAPFSCVAGEYFDINPSTRGYVTAS